MIKNKETFILAIFCFVGHDLFVHRNIYTNSYAMRIVAISLVLFGILFWFVKRLSNIKLLTSLYLVDSPNRAISHAFYLVVSIYFLLNALIITVAPVVTETYYRDSSFGKGPILAMLIAAAIVCGWRAIKIPPASNNLANSGAMNVDRANVMSSDGTTGRKRYQHLHSILIVMLVSLMIYVFKLLETKQPGLFLSPHNQPILELLYEYGFSIREMLFVICATIISIYSIYGKGHA